MCCSQLQPAVVNLSYKNVFAFLSNSCLIKNYYYH
jgi:hypothetical protein